MAIQLFLGQTDLLKVIICTWCPMQVQQINGFTEGIQVPIKQTKTQI